MSQIVKLIKRLQQKPKDLDWSELVKILAHFGYTLIKQGKTGGSRRKFINAAGVMISLHEPHPTKILKQYQIEQVLEHLIGENKL